MTPLPRWLKRLAVPGAQLKPVPDTPDLYAVLPGGDMRRRPLARVAAETVRHALAEGWLTGQADDGYRLADRPDALAARRAGDFATPHRQTGSRAIADGSGEIRHHAVNLADSPLARWRRPRAGASWLSAAEFEAGERLRADYHRSTLSERITSDWDSYLAPVGGRQGARAGDAPASALAAKARVDAALAAVGPGLDRVLSAVCLRERGLENVEQDEAWPRRSGKVVLKLALQRLGRFYGLPV